jgi:uncharacterized protein
VTTFQVFADSECSSDVGRVLIEGRTYYCRFPTKDERIIKTALWEAGLEPFVTWNRLNTVATIRIVNRIGLVSVFGRVFDVRSEKLLETHAGTRQFQNILDDLEMLSRHILFDSRAAPGALRRHRTDSDPPSLLERFNYFRQTCLPVGSQRGLATVVEQILRHPHSRLVEAHVQDHAWNIRKPSRRTLQSLFRHDQTFVKLPSAHHLCSGRPGLKPPGSASGYFPLKALRNTGEISFDTAENRFVKHVLLDIQSVCRDVIRQELVSGSLLQQCQSLLNLAQSLLLRDFFTAVGQLEAVPHSSPSLTLRAGYRDLYRIFVRSRVGAKHLFEDFVEESLLLELKDVALLYEYWVFYKIAAVLLGPEALFKSREAIVKNGRIVNSAVVSDGVYTIHFNRTFARRPGASYSVRLRPDVVIEKHAQEGTSQRLFLLDAKYKSSDATPEEEQDPLLQPIRMVQVSDLHKMHCYADAIEGVDVAVAVYPGNQFLFYHRDRTMKPITDPAAMFTLSGVGAVPLMPGAPSSELEKFLAT